MTQPKRYELTLSQWQRIENLLPGKVGDPGRTGGNNLQFVNGVLWVLRSGAHWHDLPERYGKWKTAHNRFTRWAQTGVFEHLIDDPDNDYVSLDSTLVRAHQQAATGKGAAKKGGSGSGAFPRWTDDKIHMAVDGCGRPLRIILTPGQRGDTPIAPALLEGLKPFRVLADKAYDSNTIRALVAHMQAEAIIPCNPT